MFGITTSVSSRSNATVVLHRDLNSFINVFADEHLIARSLQEPANRFPEGRFVFDHQNPLGSSLRRRHFGSDDRLRRLKHPRQVDLELGSASLFTVDLDESAALFDDPVNHREPQSSAFPYLLGGKERLENSSLRFLIHSNARVPDR